MKKGGLILVLAVLVAGAAVVQAQKIDVVLRSFVEAYNLHDEAKLVNLFAEDIRYEEEGVYEVKGRAAVSDKFRWDMAVNSRIKVNIKSIRTNVAVGTAEVTSDFYNAAGIQSFSYEQIKFSIFGNKILAITVTPASGSNDQLGTSLVNFMQWCGSKKPAELNRLKDGGGFAFTANTAPRWVALLKEWKAGV